MWLLHQIFFRATTGYPWAFFFSFFIFLNKPIALRICSYKYSKQRKNKMFHFIFRLKWIFSFAMILKKMRFLITYSSQNKGKTNSFLTIICKLLLCCTEVLGFSLKLSWNCTFCQNNLISLSMQHVLLIGFNYARNFLRRMFCLKV